MKKIIENKTYGEERALYNLKDAIVRNCVFAGPEDGESALKESHGVDVSDCRFELRYPFWHMTDFTITDCFSTETSRAGMWYAENGVVRNVTVNGVKFLRECRNVSFENFTAVSPEFGWRCRDININDSTIASEYFLFETKGGKLNNFTLNGKYSFQYTENITVENSVLNTKDAFWHSKNVTVKNSTVKGEYLAWYSDGLTLIDCRIIGTQPLCYCKNLTLINCTMEDTDLSFEYSDVNADVKGDIVSVKNPKSGTITADSIGEIILENSVFSNDCVIKTRE